MIELKITKSIREENDSLIIRNTSLEKQIIAKNVEKIKNIKDNHSKDKEKMILSINASNHLLAIFSFLIRVYHRKY